SDLADVHAMSLMSYVFFFFTATPPTEIYTLSLHDALPICRPSAQAQLLTAVPSAEATEPVDWASSSAAASLSGRRRAAAGTAAVDRKSTRLNSSHLGISYAVFCLKKKKKKNDYLTADIIYR